MAEDAPSGIVYYLQVSAAHIEQLATIRHWENLKVATEGSTLWLKGFSQEQIESVEIKSMPHQIRFFKKSGKLYLLGKLLPERNVPSQLWSPIKAALPIRIESYNHNYFGFEESLSINLIPSNEERETAVLLADLKILEKYLIQAPKIRLQPISWLLLNEQKALLMGSPTLPIQGMAHWTNGNLILPNGFDLNLPIMAKILAQKLAPNQNNWLLFNEKGTYTSISKNHLKPLSLSSYRNSLLAIQKSKGAHV